MLQITSVYKPGICLMVESNHFSAQIDCTSIELYFEHKVALFLLLAIGVKDKTYNTCLDLHQLLGKKAAHCLKTHNHLKYR